MVRIRGIACQSRREVETVVFEQGRFVKKRMIATNVLDLGGRYGRCAACRTKINSRRLRFISICLFVCLICFVNSTLVQSLSSRNIDLFQYANPTSHHHHYVDCGHQHLCRNGLDVRLSTYGRRNDRPAAQTVSDGSFRVHYDTVGCHCVHHGLVHYTGYDSGGCDTVVELPNQ